MFGGVVLNLQHTFAGELLGSHECVLARIEFEPEEVRRLDELRLDRLLEDVFDGSRGRRGIGQLGCRSVPRRAPGLSTSLTGQPLVLGAAALALGDRHAIRTDRTADEKPLADEPGVVPLEAVEAGTPGARKLERLTLLEDVLLQLLPVLVAVGEDLRHQLVEIRLRGDTAQADDHAEGRHENSHGSPPYG